MNIEYTNPVWDGYLADPFVFRANGAYYAVGTGSSAGDALEANGREFPLLRSSDLVHWELLGGALDTSALSGVNAFWAPEVAEVDGKFYMYYASGRAEAATTMRATAAVATAPEGPYIPTGAQLIPSEGFTIDAHPFQDPADGTWHLFFARDYFDGPAGTALAAVRLAADMVSVEGPITTVLRASADWQVFERNRDLYGQTWPVWSTLEGPSVIARDGRYFLLYSGGRWEGNNYGVGYAVADNVLGPYVEPAGLEGPRVLRATDTAIGPGHASITTSPGGEIDMLVYHAWDTGLTARRMCMDPMIWPAGEPRCDGPSTGRRLLSA